MLYFIAIHFRHQIIEVFVSRKAFDFLYHIFSAWIFLTDFSFRFYSRAQKFPFHSANFCSIFCSKFSTENGIPQKMESFAHLWNYTVYRGILYIKHVVKKNEIFNELSLKYSVWNAVNWNFKISWNFFGDYGIWRVWKGWKLVFGNLHLYLKKPDASLLIMDENLSN